MRKFISLILFICFIMLTFGDTSSLNKNMENKVNIMKDTKIKMTFYTNEIIINIFDNTTSRDFLSMLPLTLVFEDFAGKEKISYLSQMLSVDTKRPAAGLPESDFCYYAPWGNLAVFYVGYGSASGIVKLGRIESGKENLLKIKYGTKVKFEITR